MKIAVVTCYVDPDYVRARSLRAALTKIPKVRTIIVKNRRKGLLRYPEILWKLWRVRRRERPDAYLLTFRGQEILPFVLALAGHKPVWFDEFIVPIAYAKGENHHRTPAVRLKHLLARLSEPLYRLWLRRCDAILADTAAHAELSAKLSRMNLSKYLAVPVGTDEQLFKPVASRTPSESFEVFFYGSMLPLHGLDVILEAVRLVQSEPAITFRVAGGGRKCAARIAALQSEGLSVRYERRIPFEDLPAAIAKSSLALGGPFGDTPQALHVVTGKTYQFLACGAPVVVGASPATNEFFVDKQNALVVPQADSTALAAAIIWAYGHPRELQSIADHGRTLYEKSFSTEAIARLLEPMVRGATS